MSAPEVPAVVQAWVRQLLDPEFVALVRALPSPQIDVRLGASNGKVRRHPVVVLNGGPAEYGDAGEG